MDFDIKKLALVIGFVIVLLIALFFGISSKEKASGGAKGTAGESQQGFQNAFGNPADSGNSAPPLPPG